MAEAITTNGNRRAPTNPLFVQSWYVDLVFSLLFSEYRARQAESAHDGDRLGRDTPECLAVFTHQPGAVVGNLRGNQAELAGCLPAFSRFLSAACGFGTSPA